MRLAEDEDTSRGTRYAAEKRRAEALACSVARDHRRGQREIETALVQLRLAQRIAVIGTWSFDPGVGVTDWSEEVFAIFERDPVLGPLPLAEFATLFRGCDRERVHVAIREAIARRTPYDMELRLELPDGRCKWLRAICEPGPEQGPAGHRLLGTIQDITARKQTEEALRRRERQFRSLVESSSDIVYALDPAGTFTYVSPNWQTFMGEPASCAVGRPYACYVHPDDVDTCRRFLSRVLTSGEAQHRIEYRVRRVEGTWRWHVSSGAPLRDDVGAVIGHVGIARDVTEERQDREALRLSEARHRLLAEQFPNGALFLVDRSYRFLSAGGRALGTVGLTREMIVGRAARDVFPDLWELIEPKLRRAFAGEPDTYEVAYRGRWYTNQTVPVPAADGTIDQVIVVTQDVTEQRWSDEALRASEERFRALLDDVAMVSVQGYAADGTTIFWNDGSRQLYGYSREEALGRNLLDLIIPPEMHTAVARDIQQMAASGKPVPAAELELVRKDGSRVTVFSSHCILTRPGRACELYCIDVDLTSVRAAEQERERLREQLAQAQKMESLGSLAGGVAHDFNNMLSVILGHAEFACLAAAPEAPLGTHLKEIRRAAERSADLVRQLLAFARRQPAAPKWLDLNRTIGDMLAMLRRLIGENIALAWDPGEPLDAVHMDPAQIDQVLANLVVNARDAIDGAGRIAISTRNVEAQEMPREVSGHRGIALTVRDDGQGMDRATQARIFEPFFTTKALGEGTGLGLATVYGIVKQNRGAITVDSAPGQGTCFTIFLPADGGAVLDDEPQPDGTELPRGNELLLLVEDEGAIVSLGRRMLERLGYRVLTASGPDEALCVMQQHAGEVELLLTDVVMPGMTGRELAQRLAERQRDLAVLYMSGYPADVVSQQGVIDEDVHFLAKPFTLRDLAIAVRRALDGER